MPTNISAFIYYKLVYDYLSSRIREFGLDLMHQMMLCVSAVALVLVTLWILVQGYRYMTGQARESLMGTVTHMTRVVIIVTAASTTGVFGTDLHTFFTDQMSTAINQLMTGSNDTPAETIDKNLAYTQLALSTIDAVKIDTGDTELSNDKARAELLAAFGSASPPMAAGAMLLLYQFTMALFIGLGPLFILCLIFDQTKDLFRRWLLYGIGTIFSMAVLSAVVAIVLGLTLRVAAAVWGARIANGFLQGSSEGLSSQALQQGGIGLLLTALIISVPPMAAAFFQGTAGQFMHFSAFSGGTASRPGPQGQPPGSYGGGHSALQASSMETNAAQQVSGALSRNRGSNNATSSNLGAGVLADAIKLATRSPTTRDAS